MSHENNLAIVFFEGNHHGLKAFLKLLANRGRGGRWLAVNQLGDQLKRRTIRLVDAHRSFPVHGSALGLAVSTVSVDDVVFGDVPQPKMKRHVRPAQIIFQSLTGFNKHFLDDIAGIHAGGNGAVDHSPDWLPMASQKLVHCFGLALAGFGQELLRYR
jgi:hypothetical protein